jgi:hypothetical protein
LHSSALGWAVLLIGVGFLLFQRGAERTTERGSTGPSSSSDVAPGLLPTSSVTAARQRRPRERSPLGWLSLGVALAAAGLVAVLRNSGTVDLSLSQALAIPLAILGAGLLVGTFYGRARWTFLLGMPLVPLVIVTSAFTVPMTGPYGSITVNGFPGFAQLRSSYTRSAGDLSLDLSRIPRADLPPTIDIAVGAGTVQVILPSSGVRVLADVNLGYVGTELGSERESTGVDVHGTTGDPQASTVVTVHVDVGSVQTWTGTRNPSKAGNRRTSA